MSVTEYERVNATFRLGTMRERHPELQRAEASARLDLAAAIIAMDEKGGEPGEHNLAEQYAVNDATHAYAQALADLLRGEAA